MLMRDNIVFTSSREMGGLTGSKRSLWERKVIRGLTFVQRRRTRRTVEEERGGAVGSSHCTLIVPGNARFPPNEGPFIDEIQYVGFEFSSASRP